MEDFYGNAAAGLYNTEVVHFTESRFCAKGRSQVPVKLLYSQDGQACIGHFVKGQFSPLLR